MLKVLRTKQEELEGDDFMPLILERDKREAALKEENATLKKTLEEKELQLQVWSSELHAPFTTTPTAPSHHDHTQFPIP